MNLLPLYNDIEDRNEPHKVCRYREDVLLPDIDYEGCAKSGCVSMQYIKVCDKCRKFKYVGQIPIPINPETVKKYNIDVEKNVSYKEVVLYKIETIYDKKAKFEFQKKVVNGEKIVRRVAVYMDGTRETVDETSTPIPYHDIEKLIQDNSNKWKQYLVSSKLSDNKKIHTARYIQPTEEGIKIYWKRIIKF